MGESSKYEGEVMESTMKCKRVAGGAMGKSREGETKLEGYGEGKGSMEIIIGELKNTYEVKKDSEPSSESRL